MATERDVPEEYREIVKKYYVEPYGEIPAVLASRMNVGAKLAPEYNMSVEKMRADALTRSIDRRLPPSRCRPSCPDPVRMMVPHGAQ